ncbi:unnamed protein product [Peronospora destructor]|uniref:DNA/RNA-binding protein Kin17 WH-like domain-containing protein n=1 Tax=Peronospora destructor TaxID=86335 RepID=A0AAV0V7Z4_9STRA|nr:unnamed protein product [Peronospora destructor]
MGKHDFLTPKAIGIRMKSKGLQKLRWFCQVCQKQCRDENGFKCHTTSEAHQRQMLIVANDPNKFMSGYSEMFEEAFLENLRRRHGTKRMRATHVYNEYIADKMHIHMNATQWETLGSFVQYLGRIGKCIVDETEKVIKDKKTREREETESDANCSGKRHAVGAIMEEDERHRNKKSRRLEEESKCLRKDNWVVTGIVVKVMNKKVGDGQYYKCKGAVKDVEDKFCASVELLDSGDVLRLDQDDLETVIPKPGRKVKIVNGLGRGCTAKLLNISVADFCARIRIDSGSHRGEILDRVEYEDICRLADEQS